MEPQWERLAEAVRTRRASRGWSQAAVTERGGPSDTLQNRIEAGRWKPVRGVEDSLRKIDAGMEWREGSASRILSGGEAIELEAERDGGVDATAVGRSGVANRSVDVDVDLGKVIDALNLVYGSNAGVLKRLVQHPFTSPEERIALLESSVRSVDAYAEFLITAASQSADPRTRDSLSGIFAARAETESLLSKIMGEKETLRTRGPSALTFSQHVRAEIPSEMLTNYSAAGASVSSHMTIITTALNERAPITTLMTHQLLAAIDDYVAAARQIVGVLKANEARATRQQIEGTLPFLEIADEYVGVIREFLSILTPGAPNAEEKSQLAARQQSLEALSEYVRGLLDAWTGSTPTEAVIYNFSQAQPITAPPHVDDLGVAASRREKQSDRDNDEDPSLWWWVVAPDAVTQPQTTPPAVTDAARAVIPNDLFSEYQAALAGVQSRTNAVTEAVVEQRLTTEKVHALLDAVDAYGQTARTLTQAMQRVELDATDKQIDVALPVFRYAESFADTMSRYVGDLLTAAPNQYESNRLLVTQQALRDLSQFHRAAQDAWVKTGRSSSRPGVPGVRGNVPYLTPDEFLPSTVNPTPPGDKKAN
ncbi:helix-turn-helix domain-containing protein [Mycobacteroides chelonae]|uniref:helix-turn-helix domain-containing protein n=1 Tax=Mycobacteroides chelonae TaxID=1774 RepID=UPI00222F2D66|nr:helix-turn-helix domain-containing protein [Mycobacteroides chelonae]